MDTHFITAKVKSVLKIFHRYVDKMHATFIFAVFIATVKEVMRSLPRFLQ